MTAAGAPTQHSGRRAFGDGARAASSVTVGYIPFALALGASFAATDVDPWASWSSSWLLFGGAAQATAVTMLDAGDAAGIIIASCLVLNARHLLYSASLRPHIRTWTPRTRLAAAYFLTDPIFAIATARFTARPATSDEDRRHYYFGAAVTGWSSWLLLTGAGLLFGERLPAQLPLHLAAPLTFLLLLLPLLTTRAAWAAATVGAIVGTAASGLPMGTGVLAAIVAGVIAGGLIGGAR